MLGILEERKGPKGEGLNKVQGVKNSKAFCSNKILEMPNSKISVQHRNKILNLNNSNNTISGLRKIKIKSQTKDKEI